MGVTNTDTAAECMVRASRGTMAKQSLRSLRLDMNRSSTCTSTRSEPGQERRQAALTRLHDVH